MIALVRVCMRFRVLAVLFTRRLFTFVFCFHLLHHLAFVAISAKNGAHDKIKQHPNGNWWKDSNEAGGKGFHGCIVSTMLTPGRAAEVNVLGGPLRISVEL